MNILILGSGGREHALAWKISQSKYLSRLYIAPGNPGTERIGENIDIQATDFVSIKQLALDKNIDLIVVGPETPLVEGIYDYFLNDEELKKIHVIGPSKEGAKLEGSKDFAKKFMQNYNIPTAKFKTITKENISEGNEFMESLKPPYVLKADGLAAGKGVLIISDLHEAKISLKQMLDGQFGNASSKVVIEEFLDGIEVSMFVITDGKNYKILPEAKDYKRIGEGNTGLNTGGMGAVSPVSFVTEDFKTKVEEKIIIPTILGLQKENIIYKGFIFIGLMNVFGNPYVIEYNVRLGDPETEAILPRIKSDFVELLTGVTENNLDTKNIELDNRTVCTVMLVSGGYPENYQNGKEIKIDKNIESSILFHAGTKITNKKLVTNGGRVISVSSYGFDIQDSLKKSYLNAEAIHFDGKYFRTDIGFDLL
jgi:phosphoribosylamine--glycine ligase